MNKKSISLKFNINKDELNKYIQSGCKISPISMFQKGAVDPDPVSFSVIIEVEANTGEVTGIHFPSYVPCRKASGILDNLKKVNSDFMKTIES